MSFNDILTNNPNKRLLNISVNDLTVEGDFIYDGNSVPPPPPSIASIPSLKIGGNGASISPTNASLLTGVIVSNFGVGSWSTGTFTADEAGVYEFSLMVNYQVLSSSESIVRFVVNGIDAEGYTNPTIGVSFIDWVYNLSVNDTLSVKVLNNSLSDSVLVSGWNLTIKKLAPFYE